jgi:hypothetical protein
MVTQREGLPADSNLQGYSANVSTSRNDSPHVGAHGASVDRAVSFDIKVQLHVCKVYSLGTLSQLLSTNAL